MLLDSINRLTLLWDKPAEVAERLYAWAKSSEMIGKVATVYELHQGEDMRETEFYCMDEGVVRKALDVLVKQSRAVLLESDIHSDEDGVKFL